MCRSTSSGWQRSGVLLPGDGEAGDAMQQECSKVHVISITNTADIFSMLTGIRAWEPASPATL
jgi:hypothetical protein